MRHEGWLLAALVLFGAALATRVPGGAGTSKAAAAGPCPAGFTPRLAQPDDAVCVGWMSRERIRLENRIAAGRTVADVGTGAPRCLVGFVSRDAVVGDRVCVTPSARAWVQMENERFKKSGPSETVLRGSRSP